MRTDYYVYLILRPNGIPCYVGKGSNKRWAVYAFRCHNPHLAAIIKSAPSRLPLVKLRENLTEIEAFETEKLL